LREKLAKPPAVVIGRVPGRVHEDAKRPLQPVKKKPFIVRTYVLYPLHIMQRTTMQPLATTGTPRRRVGTNFPRGFHSTVRSRPCIRAHAASSNNNEQGVDLGDVLGFIRDRLLGDFRSSNGPSRNILSPDRSTVVDAEHRGVLSSTVRRTLADTVTDLDTRDAMEACAGVTGEFEKEECFVTFGVSKEADLWYGTVHRFEELLRYDTEPIEESVHDGKERC